MSETGTIAGPELGPLYGPEHADYRESFQTFLTREVKPAYPDWRKQREIPRELLLHAGEQGYLGMQVPEEHGGVGVDDPRFGAILGEEAMLAGAPALALLLVTHNDVALPAILEGTSEEWKAENLPALASGESLATVLRGEIAAEGSGDGLRLSGTAEMVINGTAADTFVVLATRGEDEPVLGLVSADADGVTVQPSEPPIGLDPAGLATVRLDGAQGLELGSPAEALEISHAFALAVTALAGTRAALAITTEYVTDRKAFGVPIASFQNTRRLLAGIAAEIEVADAFVERAIRRRASGSLTMPEAASGKHFCTELYGRSVDAGLQMHGGYGYIMEYEIAHAFADARFWRLTGSPSQRMLDSIAETIFPSSS